MPLIKSASREAVSENIRREKAAGKPQRQAVAIALDVQRRAKRQDGGRIRYEPIIDPNEGPHGRYGARVTYPLNERAEVFGQGAVTPRMRGPDDKIGIPEWKAGVRLKFDDGGYVSPWDMEEAERAFDPNRNPNPWNRGPEVPSSRPNLLGGQAPGHHTDTPFPGFSRPEDKSYGRVHDIATRAERGLKHYLGPHFYGAGQKVAALTEMFAPGSGELQAGKDFIDAKDAYLKGEYGHTTRDVGLGLVNATVGALPGGILINQALRPALNKTYRRARYTPDPAPRTATAPQPQADQVFEDAVQSLLRHRYPPPEAVTGMKQDMSELIAERYPQQPMARPIEDKIAAHVQERYPPAPTPEPASVPGPNGVREITPREQPSLEGMRRLGPEASAQILTRMNGGEPLGLHIDISDIAKRDPELAEGILRALPAETQETIRNFGPFTFKPEVPPANPSLLSSDIEKIDDLLWMQTDKAVAKMRAHHNDDLAQITRDLWHLSDKQPRLAEEIERALPKEMQQAMERLLNTPKFFDALDKPSKIQQMLAKVEGLPSIPQLEAKGDAALAKIKAMTPQDAATWLRNFHNDDQLAIATDLLNIWDRNPDLSDRIFKAMPKEMQPGINRFIHEKDFEASLSDKPKPGPIGHTPDELNRALDELEQISRGMPKPEPKPVPEPAPPAAAAPSPHADFVSDVTSRIHSGELSIRAAANEVAQRNGRDPEGLAQILWHMAETGNPMFAEDILRYAGPRLRRDTNAAFNRMMEETNQNPFLSERVSELLEAKENGSIDLDGLAHGLVTAARNNPHLIAREIETIGKVGGNGSLAKNIFESLPPELQAKILNLPPTIPPSSKPTPLGGQNPILNEMLRVMEIEPKPSETVQAPAAPPHTEHPRLGRLPDEIQQWIRTHNAELGPRTTPEGAKILHNYVLPHYNGDFQVFTNKFFDGHFKPGEITFTGSEMPDGGFVLRIGGNLYQHGTGPYLANTSRRIEVTPTGGHAHHGYLQLANGSRGVGVTKGILKNQVELYNNLNLDYISNLANIDVGGYAWARYGFLSPTTSSWRSLSNYLHTEMDGFRRRGSLLARDFEPLSEYLRKSDTRGLWDFADAPALMPRGMRDSTFTIFVGGQPVEKQMKWSQRLLTMTNWDGKFDLRSTITMRRFNDYVSKKDK